ncbi:SH3 domain-containing protein [Streptomyces phaeoluteigriseus]
MRTTPALRTPAAALLTACTLAAAALGTTASASATVDGTGSGDESVRGTVTSRTDLTLRQAPTTHAPSAGTLAPGSRDRVECRALGQSVNGDAHWYWLVGARAWASAAFVDTGGRRVPDCADPCPRWKDHGWANWHDAWDDETWSVTGSGSAGFGFAFSGSWSSGATRTSSDGWEWTPLAR